MLKKQNLLKNVNRVQTFYWSLFISISSKKKNQKLKVSGTGNEVGSCSVSTR